MMTTEKHTDKDRQTKGKATERRETHRNRQTDTQTTQSN